MLSVFITGDGDITHENAKALLEDYLPPENECTIFIHRYFEIDLGMCNVVDALGIMGRTSLRADNPIIGSIKEKLKEHPTTDKLVVLMLAHKRDEHGQCLPMSEPVEAYIRYFNGVEILDMSRGLLALCEGERPSEYPLYGPHLNAAGTKVSGDTHANPAIENPHFYVQSPGEIPATDMETTMRAHVTTKEENWHSPVPEAPVIPEGTTPYYKSKTGKLRKAGKSKARPGEELVYLTEEEVNVA